MCGIAVALGQPNAAAAVAAMIAQLRHRGEVSDPVFSPRAGVAMATRRLPIVDPERGAQPQPSFDGRTHVVLNGEIYNHAELRGELTAMGAPFRTESDVEVAATALQVWGAAAFERFEGMYALVAVDLSTGDWLAARDPLGVKPLYVVEDAEAGAWLFCSEIRPLLAAVEALPVLTLPPGRILTGQGCFRYTPRWRRLPGDEAALDAALRAAVHRRIPPDQACATFFSGGLDSSLVLRYALELRPSMPAYVLGDAGAPDLSFAQDYAAALGADLSIVPLQSADMVISDDIAQAVAAMETFEPETVRSGHCSLRLAKAVHADGLRVALCGDGADELFAGYLPLEEAFAIGGSEGEAVRQQCLASLSVTALQRLDRGGMSHQVEIREPFLDSAVVAIAMGCGREQLGVGGPGDWTGKQPLRRIAAGVGLPSAIRDRPKTPLNEGAGLDCSQSDAPWVRHAQETVSDAELREGAIEYAAYAVTTKEELLYLRTLSQTLDVSRVPHLRERPFIRMPAAAVTTRLAGFIPQSGGAPAE